MAGSMNLNINTGGRVIPVYANDKGKTTTVEYRPAPEKAHERLNREITNRAKSFYPNPNESALERQLFNQVAGDEVLTDNKVSAQFEAEFNTWRAQQTMAQSRVTELETALFNQIANHGKTV